MRLGSSCDQFAALSARQSEMASRSPISFFAGAMLAGGFVSAAQILSLSVGAHLGPEWRPLVMGCVFGLSIILTIFGGGELFTGQAMFAAFGLMRRTVTLASACETLLLVWLGNFSGVVVICSMFAAGGGGHVFAAPNLLHDLIAFKIQSSALALCCRAMLCNWLACMGIWTAARLADQAAKMMVLAWAVMAYVACGLEHSIADMAVFTLGLLSPMPLADLGGAVSTVLLVTAGNLAGGGLMVAMAYAVYARGEATSPDRARGPAGALGDGDAVTSIPALALAKIG